tara:strand:+ start:4587 stop:5195 length:609 start_codon:yes stop_codon:yes gene_type:complete
MITTISEKSLEEILDRKIESYPFDLHWTDFEDTRYVINLLKGREKILELGTFLGYTTKNIANFTGSRDITTVDIVKEKHSVVPEFQEHELLSIKDSGKMIDHDFVKKVHKTTDDFFKSCNEKWDGIFIDASHDYDQVIRDSENSIKHLNQGGVIVWHDVYNFDNSCSKCQAEPPNTGVVDALNDLNYDIKKVSKSWVAFLQV